ncbi:MAG TPA: hypothetical protein VH087_00915, partial [Thermoanaerobaculia bacterium]|nr:hypothetical protein [Thermoanaerobaculia bacterium]
MKRESGGTMLILGGAGMVGVQVAREAARELHPSRIVIAALTKAEVDDAVRALQAEIDPVESGVEFIGAPGNIFLPQSLQGVDRGTILSSREHYDDLFSEIFSREADYTRSALFHLIDEHKPETIVDCINTATAISYQDEFKASQKVKSLLDAAEAKSGSVARSELDPLFRAVRELLISQGIPQITRHILFLHRALEQTEVRVYVKVGTTGTGGMGINIPYTHSEDKPSPQLVAKSAIGFAHTGLLFLLARTPSGSIVKEVKPGAMIGFRQ